MNLNNNLAYFIGIHLGDGTMNHYRKYDYYISYSGHIIDEKEFYSVTIKNLINKLFNINPIIRLDKRKNRSSIRLTIYSKSMFNFMTTKIGLYPGPKSKIGIPEIIKNSNLKIKKNFIKGLADTDFSLTFKKREKDRHYYPTIAFSSNNKRLVQEVNNMLINLGFNTTVSFDMVHKREDKVHITHSLNINGNKQVREWMRLIGFNSSKHLTKYKLWEKYGFCPSNTNLIKRNKILNGILDINTFYSKPL